MMQYPLTIPISVGIKEIDLLFWMRPITIDTMMKRLRINNPYAALYLQKVVDYKARQNMNPDDAKALSFAITQFNIEELKGKMHEVLNWFEPENLELLYGKTDDGTIVFNSEYRSVNVLFSNEFAGVRTAIKVVPSVVEVGNQVYEPGVVFYINKQANGVVLRRYQIERLARFIINFDFIQWMNFAMSCYQYAATTGNILPYEANRTTWT